MREIKFRGMNFCGKWVYGDLRHDRMCMPDGKLQGYISVCGEPIFPKSVGQFIGLEDCKGQEIFEGDIVKCDSGRICQVVFFTSESACCFDLLPVGGFDCEPPKKSTLWKFLTVIGNIHDNPELLYNDKQSEKSEEVES